MAGEPRAQAGVGLGGGADARPGGAAGAGAPAGGAGQAGVPAGGADSVDHVLVVDDDPDINRLVRVRLANRGYQVTSVSSGQEALDHIATTVGDARPDLLFLDVSMPGMGGLEVLDHVRRDGLDAAVVMMTAFGSEGVAIDALRRGADDYLRKPFSRDDFLGVLERTVSHLALRRQNEALRRQLDERRRQLEAELARAAQVQIDLLPRDVPAVPGFDLAARCIPAREVGGDFFDWQVLPGGALRLTLGDVMGKGMAAALLMATARAALRAVAVEPDAATAVARAAGALEPDLERSGSFVTLFRAHLDPAGRRLGFVDAGHGLAFVRRASGEVLAPGGHNLPLGMFPGSPIAGDEVQLAEGDCLVLYSDGLPDAVTDPGRALDTASLAAAVGGTSTAADSVERLLALVDLSVPAPDDLTVVVLRCTG